MTLDGMGWIVIFNSMSNLFHKDEDQSGNLFNGWSYTKKNYILFVCGVIMIILGYIIMATGETNSFQSLSLAPIILTIGYLVLIPASLLYREKE
tara:strand:+ start:379 stop:660 length:282 start_codon:yes stop_codon:yes gene_type:complete